MFTQKIFTLIWLCASGMLFNSPATAQPKAIDASATSPVSQSANVAERASLSSAERELIQSLPLRKKIGQFFIFGFMGQTIEHSLATTISTLQPGGIIIFGRNIKTARQVSDLTYNAQRLSLQKTGLPLLVAVDQEGGDVTRIHTTPPLPSALALGETGDSELVKSAGLHTGALLKALGFNMNLAPVLDISDPKSESFIGTRTFGKNSKVVTQMGVQFARGLQQAGILPTAKHFPGHGGLSEDSHRLTPEKDETLEQMLKSDLIPFSTISHEPAPWAVMVAHVSYPEVDSSHLPATFSKVIVTDVLRKRLGFQGIVMTDDIEMAGAAAIPDVGERAVRAIEAGTDLIMVAWNKKIQSRVIAATLKAAQSGRLSEARINESLERIYLAKKQFASFQLPVRPTIEALRLAMQNNSLKQVSEKTLAQRFKAAGAQGRYDEPPTGKDPVYVFSATERFYKSFRLAATTHPTRFFKLESHRTFDINKVMRANPTASGVLYVSGQQSARFANFLAADVASRFVLINSEAEGLLKSPKIFRSIVDVYFRNPDLGKFAANYIFTARHPAAQDGADPDVGPATEPDAEAKD
jgi:beta-N-acetylhexosaminidase